MDKVERATWEICCRNCAPTKPGGVIPERPRNGFLTSGTVAPTSLRFGMRLNNEYSKAHAKGQLLSPSLTLRNLYLKFAALVHSTTLPTIFWNERFRSYPQ